MPPHKRKHQEEDSDNSDGYSEVQLSDDDVDISAALTTKKPRVEEDSDDEGLKQMMLESISKRNMKSGTEILKKAKGKNLVKGEVGGGSFQSMGAFFVHYDFEHGIHLFVQAFILLCFVR